jgi:predicted XRE-type DNA-binding protein
MTSQVERVTPSSGNVFEEVGFDPDEAHNLAIRSALMMAITRLIERRGMTQRQAAELFGVAQPRVSDVVRGKIELFTIDALVKMLSAAGVKVGVVVSRYSCGPTRD